jgi:hypothetical protein
MRGQHRFRPADTILLEIRRGLLIRRGRVVQRDTRGDRYADSRAVSLRRRPRCVLRRRRQCDCLCPDVSTRYESQFAVQHYQFPILNSLALHPPGPKLSHSIHHLRVSPSRATTPRCTASPDKSSLCSRTFAHSPLPPGWYRTRRPSLPVRVRVLLAHRRPGMNARSTLSSSVHPGEAQNTSLDPRTRSPGLSLNRLRNCSALRG